MEEIWKDIQGYEGYYQISSLGRVKSLSRSLKIKYGYRITKEKIMINKFGTFGYSHITLCMFNSSKIFLVHRLVAKAFIPNPNNYPQVNHIDGNKQNNLIENLEWATKSMNAKHAYKIGLRGVGEDHQMAKLTDKKVLDIREIYNDDFLTLDEIAEE